MSQNWTQGFWSGFLREEDGTPSFSRLASLLVILAALSWTSYVVFKNHILPNFDGIKSYLVTVLSSLYGINKGVTALKNVFGKADQPDQPNQ